MPLSKAEIVNTAFGLCGIKRTASLASNTSQVRQMNAQFDASSEGMLVLPYNWRFAITTAELSELTSPEIGHYDYRYATPSKCLKVLATVDEDDYEIEYEWERELYVDANETEQDCILSNEDGCFIRYVRNVNLARWPAWFGRLVSLDMAILMVNALTQDKGKIQANLIGLMSNPDPKIGWLARAIVANDEYDRTNADNINLELGNRDVLDAMNNADITSYRYIKTE